VRDYWVYVPKQYEAAKPTCVTILQDGLNRAKGWKLLPTLDNLIHEGSIPVTIGIFISPGVVPAPHDGAQPRFNRSFEYDALGDRYARFLIEEILPEVGKSFNLSEDPNDRLIGGASSGAICAFNAAWERPDAFRRVLSTIGTYVGLRGGHEIPVLVRKTEHKPIRVFLQDGVNDLNLYAGYWWTANLDMSAALEWAGYEVKHEWGEGGHNSKHAAAIIPDALRWIWKDYPTPVGMKTAAERRTDLLIPGEEWELVGDGYRFTEGPAVNAQGEVFFTDLPDSKIYKIDLKGKVHLFAEDTGNANGLMFDRQGNLTACANGKKQLVSYDINGKKRVLTSELPSNDVVVAQNGYYFTDPSNKKVHYLDLKGRVRVVDTGIEFPNGLVLSPDKTLLYVADMRGGFVYSFQSQPNGDLLYKQPYFHLHIPYGATESGADGMTVDTQGRLYVATHMGVQVCDQPGRVHFIISKPQNAWLSNVVFGGPDLDVLYATSGDKVFRRRLRAQGLPAGVDPIKPPRPRL
jgi:gluconolactonase